MAVYLARQSVAGVDVFRRLICHKTTFIPTCVESCSLTVNKARWRNRSSSSRAAPTLDVLVTIAIDASHVASTTGLRYVHRNGRAMSAEIGYLKRGLCWTKRWSRSRNVRWQLLPRERTAWWMIPLSFMRQKTDCRPHPSKREMTGQHGSSRTRRRKPRQPPRPRRLRLRIPWEEV